MFQSVFILLLVSDWKFMPLASSWRGKPFQYLTSLDCPVVYFSAMNLQKVLVKATNLIASFEVLGGNVTAIFSWDISMTSSHQQLTGYQVTWAEVISTNRNYNVKLPRTLISQSQILPPVSEVTLLNYTMWKIKSEK